MFVVETGLKSSDDGIEPLPEYYKLMNNEGTPRQGGKRPFREATLTYLSFSIYSKMQKHSYYIALFILYCIYLFMSLYNLFFLTNFKCS